VLYSLLAFIALLCVRSSVEGQPAGATAGDMLQKAQATLDEAKKVKGQLDLNLNIDAKVDARVKVNFDGLIEKLDGLVGSLKDSLKNDLGKPIQSLGDNIRESFTQLDSTVKGLDSVLTRQRTGLAQDLGVLAASLETIALEFDSNLKLIGKTGAPRIYHFIFDGSSLNSVPKRGGWCNLTGFRLWKNADPRVEIVDESKEKLIATPKVKRGRSDNEVSVFIDKELIAKNVGNILYIKVVPIQKEGGWFSRKMTALDELYTALIIPQDFNTKVILRGFMSSKVPTIKKRQLESKNARFDNESCENKLPVSRKLTWTLMPSGKLVELGASKGEVRNSTSVNYTISGDSIVVSGEIDTATCVQVKIPPFGPNVAKLLHSTIWSYNFSPTEEYPSFDEKVGNEASAALNIDDNPRASLQVPTPAQSDDNVMWCEVVFVDGKKERTVFTSPREIANPIAQRSYSFGQYSLEARFNARVTQGTSEAHLTLKKLQ